MRPQQPWLHQLQTAVRGNETCLSDGAGDIDALRRPESAAGLYVDDRRVLHHLRLTVDGQRPDVVVADSAGPETAVLLVARRIGDAGADPTTHLERSLRLVDDGLDLTVVIRSRSMQPIGCGVRLELAGDGAELHEVKAGVAVGEPLEITLDTDGRASWADARHRTVVESQDGRVGLDRGVLTMDWDVALPPGGSRSLVTRLRVARTSATPFDAGCGADQVGWGRVQVDAQDQRLGRTVRRSLTDLRHLLLSDPLDGEDVFAAAGSPWYLTLFGRDSLWAARMSLPLGTELARGTLRALARRQGRVDDTGRAEQPGKILHEVRRSTIDDPDRLHLPPLYYGTVDATPLWIALLHDAWRWGLPDTDVAALAPALEGALGWLRRAVDGSPDGLVRYLDESGEGLTNQGWKDSGDAMRNADGRIADGPIALIETQAYAVEAALGAAELLERVLGRPGDVWRSWADALATRVRETFWVDDQSGPYLAMALDGKGDRVDGLGSNMGHALGTGLLTADEERAVADRLIGPDLLGPIGISTLSRSNPGYNPLGYHTGSVWTHDTAIAAWGLQRSGQHGAAATVLRTLIDVAAASGFRWAELYSSEPVIDAPAPYPASCRPQAWAAASAGLVLSTALGITADAPDRQLTVAPLPEAPFGALRVAGLEFAGEPLQISTDHRGRVTNVDTVAGIEILDWVN